jgi:hypothetical protein
MRTLRRAITTATAIALLGVPAAAARTPPSNPHVSFDRFSLSVDGRRVVLDSGEVHPFRMPSPRAWPAVLDRMRAAGLNAISIYVPWSVHEPAPGVARFTGRWDLERFLALARDRRLYVVVRHGPYVQGEIDGGGFPAWATARPAQFRTDDPRWTALWKSWDAQVLPRVARWQIGGPRRGTVIAVQIENEYPGDGTGSAAYMRDLYEDTRAHGIAVPILHNDQQVLGSLPAPGRYEDIVDLYGFDNYPYGFTCCKPWTTATFSQLDGFEDRYRADGATHAPLYMPEVQGGAAPIAGDDGASLADRYERFRGYATVQNLSLLGQGVTMVNQYMFFGGTTWGNLPFPNLGTTYDYAAPIRETGALGPRYEEQRRLSLQVAAAGPSLAATQRADGAVTADDADALYRVRRAVDGGALFVVLRHADGGAPRAPRLTIGGEVTPPVPLPPRSARLLFAGFTRAGWRIDWSTAEVALVRPDLLVLFGDRGERYAARIGGRRLDFTVGGARLIHVARGRDVLVVDRTAAGRLWERAGGQVLVGPVLVSAGRVSVDRAQRLVAVRRGRLRRIAVPGPPGRIAVPRLRGWRFHAEAPEREPGYDDRAWRPADVTDAALQYRSLTSPLLFADVYGMPTGYVWYRGRFTGRASGVCVEGRHRYHAWLNGRSLGTVTSAAEAPGPAGLGGLGAFPLVSDPRVLRFPADAVREGENVLAVLTDDWGHTMDAVAANQAKQPRGLLSAALDRTGLGAVCGTLPVGEGLQVFGQASVTLPPGAPRDGGIAWRLHGGRPLDYPNTSGLHGELSGWHTRSFDDRAWARVALPDAGRLADGEIGWYRTAFRWRPPRDVRAPLLLELPRGGHPAEVYLNGVHVARAGRDRETRFALPEGVLRTDGSQNVLAIARWNVGGGTGPLPAPRLVAAGPFERQVRLTRG